jgi:hypothetical protein
MKCDCCSNLYYSCPNYYHKRVTNLDVDLSKFSIFVNDYEHNSTKEKSLLQYSLLELDKNITKGKENLNFDTSFDSYLFPRTKTGWQNKGVIKSSGITYNTSIKFGKCEFELLNHFNNISENIIFISQNSSVEFSCYNNLINFFKESTNLNDATYKKYCELKNKPTLINEKEFHKLKIICADKKPENLIINEKKNIIWLDSIFLIDFFSDSKKKSLTSMYKHFVNPEYTESHNSKKDCEDLIKIFESVFSKQTKYDKQKFTKNLTNDFINAIHVFIKESKKGIRIQGSLNNK